ncbi:hypothetical protein HPB47_008304 [Ixodes persulcatus]|uniref:Uncharacterized protein n=1 Tax=Ixodes persulcatus TaxID=34615 RepID=A0AC60P517_IXOPE|nr:hypothetical protein HPB47_008304 [Ixodes persulcatus]
MLIQIQTRAGVGFEPLQILQGLKHWVPQRGLFSPCSELRSANNLSQRSPTPSTHRLQCYAECLLRRLGEEEKCGNLFEGSPSLELDCTWQLMRGMGEFRGRLCGPQPRAAQFVRAPISGPGVAMGDRHAGGFLPLWLDAREEVEDSSEPRDPE